MGDNVSEFLKGQTFFVDDAPKPLLFNFGGSWFKVSRFCAGAGRFVRDLT